MIILARNQFNQAQYLQKIYSKIPNLCLKTKNESIVFALCFDTSTQKVTTLYFRHFFIEICQTKSFFPVKAYLFELCRGHISNARSSITTHTVLRIFVFLIFWGINNHITEKFL